MAYNYIEFFQVIESFGVMDALLPFLLIFTLIFAILQKTEILGTGRKNFNVVLAMIIGASVVIPHVTGRYPPNGDIVVIINKALPQVSVIIVAVIMLLIMVGVFGHQIHIAGTSLAAWLIVASILIIGFIFGHAAGWFQVWPNWLGWLRDSKTQALVIILLVFAIMVGFIASDGSDKGKPGLNNAFQKIGDILKT